MVSVATAEMYQVMNNHWYPANQGLEKPSSPKVCHVVLVIYACLPGDLGTAGHVG